MRPPTPPVLYRINPNQTPKDGARPTVETLLPYREGPGTEGLNRFAANPAPLPSANVLGSATDRSETRTSTGDARSTGQQRQPEFSRPITGHEGFEAPRTHLVTVRGSRPSSSRSPTYFAHTFSIEIRCHSLRWRDGGRSGRNRRRAAGRKDPDYRAVRFLGRDPNKWVGDADDAQLHRIIQTFARSEH